MQEEPDEGEEEEGEEAEEEEAWACSTSPRATVGVPLTASKSWAGRSAPAGGGGRRVCVCVVRHVSGWVGCGRGMRAVGWEA